MNKKTNFPMIIMSFILFTSVNCFSADLPLAWDSVSDPITGYRLYYGISSGNHPNMVDVGNVTEYDLTGLEENLTYYIVVRAYDDSEESGNSNEMIWTYPSVPGGSAPPVPTGLIQKK